MVDGFAVIQDLTRFRMAALRCEKCGPPKGIRGEYLHPHLCPTARLKPLLPRSECGAPHLFLELAIRQTTVWFRRSPRQLLRRIRRVPCGGSSDGRKECRYW